ncbi:PALP domain-containing protein, partial [Trichostrongylus colubriformis]
FELNAVSGTLYKFTEPSHITVGSIYLICPRLAAVTDHRPLISRLLPLYFTVFDYRCIIVSQDRPGRDIEDVLVALGAEVVLTNVEANHESFSYRDFAKILAQGIENSYFLDEEVSAVSSLAHYESTAAEIVTALNQKVDLIVVPVRVGAAYTGIAKYVKQHLPSTK